MNFKSRGLGMILLSIWLILTGLLPLLSINFARSATVMEVLAIAAGVFLLVAK
jgi:FtsH-binding integral membrane protein